MRQIITRISIFMLSIIIFLCISLIPIYTVDLDFLKTNLQEKIVEIQENEKPYLYEHYFKKETMENVTSNNRLTLSDFSWEIKTYGRDITFTDTEQGLSIDHPLTLTSSSFPDLFKIILYLQYPSSEVQAVVEVDDQVLEPTTTDEVRYEYVCEEKVESTLTITFPANTVIERIIINEINLTDDEAFYYLVEDLFLGSGLIRTNADALGFNSIQELSEYIYEETLTLVEGIRFYDLFRMAVVDFEYNVSVWEQTAGSTFKERINAFSQIYYCPFIGILVLLSCLGILGGVVYIIVRFIVDLILKRESRFFVPALVVVISMLVLFNLSTFTNIQFFSESHNVSTSWKLLLFEIAKEEVVFIIANVISIMMLGVTMLDSYIKAFTKKKKVNLKVVIINSSILVVSVVMLIIGIAIR